jgi:hypothetical protein
MAAVETRWLRELFEDMLKYESDVDSDDDWEAS